MEENAKKTHKKHKYDDGNKTSSISMLTKLHILLHVSLKVAGKYILLLRLIIYVLYSFTHIFSTFYNIDLLFPRMWYG